MGKILIAVEYNPMDGNYNNTFKIFESIREAYKFGMSLKRWQKRKFFIADFNKELIYEEDGELNYKDHGDLYNSFIPLNL